VPIWAAQGVFRGLWERLAVPYCPRCRHETPTLLRPRHDVVLCPPCWDLLLLLAAGDADDVDAR
jgi:hypothetical protein